MVVGTGDKDNLELGGGSLIFRTRGCGVYFVKEREIKFRIRGGGGLGNWDRKTTQFGRRGYRANPEFRGRWCC